MQASHIIRDRVVGEIRGGEYSIHNSGAADTADSNTRVRTRIISVKQIESLANLGKLLGGDVGRFLLLPADAGGRGARRRRGCEFAAGRSDGSLRTAGEDTGIESAEGNKCESDKGLGMLSVLGCRKTNP